MLSFLLIIFLRSCTICVYYIDEYERNISKAIDLCAHRKYHPSSKSEFSSHTRSVHASIFSLLCASSSTLVSLLLSLRLYAIRNEMSMVYILMEILRWLFYAPKTITFYFVLFVETPMSQQKRRKGPIP